MKKDTKNQKAKPKNQSKPTNLKDAQTPTIIKKNDPKVFVTEVKGTYQFSFKSTQERINMTSHHSSHPAWQRYRKDGDNVTKTVKKNSRFSMFENLT